MTTPDIVNVLAALCCGAVEREAAAKLLGTTIAWGAMRRVFIRQGMTRCRRSRDLLGLEAEARSAFSAAGLSGKALEKKMRAYRKEWEASVRADIEAHWDKFVAMAKAMKGSPS